MPSFRAVVPLVEIRGSFGLARFDGLPPVSLFDLDLASRPVETEERIIKLIVVN